MFEVVDDGTEWEWADVLAWEPPHRVVLAWHPTLEPPHRVVLAWHPTLEPPHRVVLAWHPTLEPPHRVVLAWHPTLEPTVSTEVEVRFNAVEGGTRVELEHRGWERLGDQALTARVDYDQGWLPVLSLYEALANS